MTKSYLELVAISDYLGRFKYLQLNGTVGRETFGFDRYLNQVLYHSDEWKKFRRDIILRDNGCDLAHEDYEIRGRIYIHHLNPITKQDVLNRSRKLFDSDNAVCVSYNTHQAIHYSDENLLILPPVERRPNDTCPWRH